jgi:signal transduction histidine kinase
MHKTTNSLSAASIVVSAGPRGRSACNQPSASRHPAEGGAPGPAEASGRLAQDRERIALDLNDVVVRRLFATGLDLYAALALMGDQRAAGKIDHAIEELDQAIRDIRDTIFDRLADERPASPLVLAP